MKARVAAVLLAAVLAGCGQSPREWSEAELKQIESLWLGRLGPPPASDANPVADDPTAARLGEKFFFDPRFSRDGRIACATCHKPELAFTDGQARAQGLAQLRRNTPTLLGTAWSPWLFWDGRADSLWAQALVPLEHADEMGLPRARLARLLTGDYRDEYAAVFGAPPEGADAPTLLLVQFGRALEAYTRSLKPPPTRFDRYVESLRAGSGDADFGAAERRGLKLFLGKAQCLRCHSGPLFTNQGFHNTGLAPLPGEAFDPGRARGVEEALASAFNCRSQYSAAADKSCPQLQFVRRSGPELRGAFKTPGLRAVAQTAPYMHDGRFATLAEVLEHYNRAPGVEARFGHSELFPLGLSAAELLDLEAFLRSLSAAAS